MSQDSRRNKRDDQKPIPLASSPYTAARPTPGSFHSDLEVRLSSQHLDRQQAAQNARVRPRARQVRFKNTPTVHAIKSDAISPESEQILREQTAPSRESSQDRTQFHNDEPRGIKPAELTRPGYESTQRSARDSWIEDMDLTPLPTEHSPRPRSPEDDVETLSQSKEKDSRQKTSGAAHWHDVPMLEAPVPGSPESLNLRPNRHSDPHRITGDCIGPKSGVRFRSVYDETASDWLKEP